MEPNKINQTEEKTSEKKFIEEKKSLFHKFKKKAIHILKKFFPRRIHRTLQEKDKGPRL